MTGEEFELAVRTVARAIWDIRSGAGSAEYVDDLERDLIIDTPDVTYYVECTTQRTLEKLKSDAGKLISFKTREERRNRLVKLLYVTKEEPTADQVKFGRERSIAVLSLGELSRRLLDAGQYLNLRVQYPFGSATDPKTDSSDTWELPYEPVAIRKMGDLTTALSVRDLAGELARGRVVCLLGDFGMGKSLTLKEVFGGLRASYLRGQTELCPVLLNLREHWGQDDPSEALERHAKRLGLSTPQQLVRAFNAGRLMLMLDGFDEIASVAWEVRGGARMRELRRAAVTLVREFVSQARGKCGIIIAGREHYFDGQDELRSALDLRHSDLFLMLGEFSEAEAQKYLERLGYTDPPPAWLPKRPLLLAKLAADGTLNLLLESSDVEPARAWDLLVQAVCERESRIHRAHLDPEAIRRILEVLASRARSKPDGFGPLGEDEVADTFREVVRAYPDEKTKPLLQRLPGLSARSSQTGERSFIDDQMLDALRAGDVVAFVRSPFASGVGAQEWRHGLGLLGASLVGAKLAGESHLTQFSVAAHEAVVRWAAPTLAADVVVSAGKAHPGVDEIDFGGLKIAGADVGILDFGDAPVPVNWELSESTIDSVILSDGPPNGVRLEGCLIQHLIGAFGNADVPGWLATCDVSNFHESRQTNAAIASDSSIPGAMRVLLTVLRKLYMQRGTGRQEQALSRGLDLGLREMVAPVLEVVERHRLAFPVRRGAITVWQPLAGQRGRVLALLAAGVASTDSAARDVLAIR